MKLRGVRSSGISEVTAPVRRGMSLRRKVPEPEVPVVLGVDMATGPDAATVRFFNEVNFQSRPTATPRHTSAREAYECRVSVDAVEDLINVRAVPTEAALDAWRGALRRLGRMVPPNMTRVEWDYDIRDRTYRVHFTNY